jgi:WD40 repeat protein
VVRCLVFHPDGRQAFSGGDDGVVRVWNTDTMLPLAAVEGRAAITALVVAGPQEAGGGPVLCAQDNSGFVTRWDAQTLRPVARFRPAGGTARCFSPDGRQGLWAHVGQRPRLFDLQTKGNLKTFPDALPAHGGAAFTPDGKKALLAVRDGEFALLETATGKELWRFHGARGLVSGLAATANAEHVVSIDAAGAAWLWETATSRVVRRFVPGPGRSYLSVALSADGSRALFLDRQGLMELWGLHDGLKLCSLATGSVVAAMTADARRALTVTAWGRLRLWDLERGKELCPSPEGATEARCVALSPDGRLALSGHHERLLLHDVVSGQALKAFAAKRAWVEAAAFSPDGKRFAYGDEAGKLYLCDTVKREVVWAQQAHPAFVSTLVFSPDGTRIYSGGGNQSVAKGPRQEGGIRVWDTATEQAIATFPGPLPPVRSLALSPDGARLLSGGGTGTHRDCAVRLWDVNRGEQLARYEGHANFVLGVALAPDGKRAFSVSRDSVRSWALEVAPAKAGRDLKTPLQRAVAFVGDGQVVTAGLDRRLLVWGPDGVLVGERSLPYQVNALAASADGKHLALANGNGTVYVLRLPLRSR